MAAMNPFPLISPFIYRGKWYGTYIYKLSVKEKVHTNIIAVTYHHRPYHT